ncbi:hypothetical protein SO802_010963 [Lithocarpus litseifolius]|uniref:RNase H type-1 domain-containing protein n=1 Tax=Lithocarpus litseifolius TaxID=425828 RepID=A0AAW2DG83_9ROSI
MMHTTKESFENFSRKISAHEVFPQQRSPSSWDSPSRAVSPKNSPTPHTFSKNHIDAIINKGKEDAWRFTGFYGEPVTHNRFESWDMLRQLNNRLNLPWICAGDFNEIVRSSEKLQGSNRSQAQMQLFRDVIDECGFIDLGFVGSPYTWIHHLSSDSSDHCPLWIILDGLEVASVPKLFRFEEMWLLDLGCSNVVEAMWSSDIKADLSNKVIRKIEKCGKELQRWNMDHFGNVRKELAKKRKLLVEAKKEAWRSGVNHRIRELKREISKLMDKENRMWFQRSKALWATNGDKNSKFFHSRATQRKRKNSILRIRDANGGWNSNPEDIAQCLIAFFQDLFSSANLQQNDATTNSIHRVISDEMNAQLSSEFNAWEVHQAIKQMTPLKAPGPDGMEILINAVVQTIPTYTMSCFKLPLELCTEIESLIRKFWWRQKGDRRKVHWVKWEALCQAKSEGGMGFKDLGFFIDALLAKQAWRLLHHKESIFYQVFKAKFVPNCSIMEAPDCSSGSYAWHSILRGRDVLLKGARWRVGNGQYSVRSGYRFLAKENSTNPANASPIPYGEIWKLIWSLAVLNKTVAILHAPPQRIWSPPPAQTWKVNFDGVTFKDIGKAGIGVVIRDSQGQAMASLSEQIHLPFSSDMVEALAAARAISFALEIVCSPFILEGDSELVIKTLCSEERSLASCHILESAKALTEANCISFSHVRCIGNSVANNLAKHARHVSSYTV